MFNKIMKFKYNFNPILYNRFVLYFFFALALLDLIYFLNTKDIYSFSTLILIGILVSFFNKNMTVILFISLVFTHILKYGRSSFSEGMENMEEEGDDATKATKAPKIDESKAGEMISSKIKDYSKKIDDILKTSENGNETHKELKSNLKDMQDTRDKILDNVKHMRPLLEKFQGHVDKFNTLKNQTDTSSLTNPAFSDKPK